MGLMLRTTSSTGTAATPGRKGAQQDRHPGDGRRRQPEDQRHVQRDQRRRRDRQVDRYQQRRVGAEPDERPPGRPEPGHQLAWLICQDADRSKPGRPSRLTPTATGRRHAAAPVKWTGLTSNGPGFSTPAQPAQIHTLAFGYLFEDTTTSI